MSVPKVRECLHDALLTTQQSINQTLAAWQTYSHAEDAWFAVADDPEVWLSQQLTELEALHAQESVIKQDLKQWRQFCADESWWLSLFGFLPAVSRKRQLRRELERLTPELVAQFADEDRLLWDAESHFPGGQLQLLAHEVEAGLNAFAHLSKLEQYARLKVWIGRFRYHQAGPERDGEGSEELQALAHKVFHQLKWLSRQYEPGYIEAFRQDFSTDWAAYVAEAQEQLVQAVESQRRARQAAEARNGDEAAPDAPAAVES